ncbi:JmjC domain-containing histone demethylation protein 1 [Boothiomyces sp. JEL0838]|nr:JmjC domain-containing histone demethylation protein 1 [Boothiomyces sp. JEL0838]
MEESVPLHSEIEIKSESVIHVHNIDAVPNTIGSSIDAVPTKGSPTTPTKSKKEPKPKKPVDMSKVRKSEREKAKISYQEGGEVDEYKWTKILAKREFQEDNFRRMDGRDANTEWIYKEMLKNPVLFPTPDGLEMTMPPSDLTVNQVADICGPEKDVDVVQVATQKGLKMKLREWAEYFNLPPEKRARILNVISLEIGSGEFGKMIKRPSYVRQVDWIDNIWPSKDITPEYPKVQLYCLMGVQDSYTDFHIDFGGSSVFYHVLSGEKIFYFIEPTKANLDIYKRWSMDPDQSNIFLGDLVDKVVKVRLVAQNTMHIPSGWIHAVYTPKDTMVIGGNYLHLYAAQMQIDIAKMERETNVPLRFRFPYFDKMHWYAAKKYMKLLKDPSNSIPIIDLQQIQVLIKYLIPLSKTIDDFQSTSKNDRKLVKATIPKGIKNIKLLLDNLNTAFRSRLLHIPFAPEIEWESDDSEMEFLDSNDEAIVKVDDDYSDGEIKGKKKRKKKRKLNPKSDITFPIIPNHSIQV